MHHYVRLDRLDALQVLCAAGVRPNRHWPWLIIIGEQVPATGHVVPRPFLIDSARRGDFCGRSFRRGHRSRSERGALLSVVGRHQALVNQAVREVRVSVLAQSPESALHFEHFALQLLQAPQVAPVLLLARVLLDKARLLQLNDVLIDDATVFAHFVVHPLKIFWL